MRKKIEQIVDPETGLALGAMGLIIAIKEARGGVIKVDFTPSTPYSSVAYSLAFAIKEVAEAQEKVRKAIVICHNHVLADRINSDVNRE